MNGDNNDEVVWLCYLHISGNGHWMYLIWSRLFCLYVVEISSLCTKLNFSRHYQCSLKCVLYQQLPQSLLWQYQQAVSMDDKFWNDTWYLVSYFHMNSLWCYFLSGNDFWRGLLTLQTKKWGIFRPTPIGSRRWEVVNPLSAITKSPWE